MELPRQWIVGLDLTPRSRGAARWAAWLSERSRHDPHLTALHAGDLGDFRDEHPGPGAPLDRAAEATEASLRALDVHDEFDDIRAVEQSSAVEALLDEVGKRGARGLILGRNQPSESWTMISLGSVARHVLRSTDDPVFVVPPDYEPPTRPGPVVVGVTPSDDALVAIRMAQTLGANLELPVECVHVMPDVTHFMTTPNRAVLPYATALDSPMSFEQQARRQVTEWMEDHQVELPLHFEVGPTPITLDTAAKRLGASMLITGSRQLSTVERIFQRSIGSDLAARAHIPTLVVPPTAPLDTAQAS